MMDRHMEEDSSTFLQWAMNHLQHHQNPATAAAAAAYQQDGGAGVGARISGGAGDQDAAAAFPSLQVLRASQPQTAVVPASVRVRDLTVQVGDYGGLTNSSSSGDSPGAGAGAAMDHDAVAAAWSPHTARSRTTGLGGGSNSRPVSWNFSAASALPADDRGAVAVALPDATTAAVARVQQRAASASAGRRGGSAGPSAAASSPGPVQDHIIAERRRREKINQRFIELSTVIPGLKKVIIS